jgi:membrane-associated phospholipid phosphatase
VAAGLWVTDRALAPVALAGALVLSFSLVYVGVQYPSDQLVGLLIGAVVALGLRPAGTAVLRWLAVRVERSPLHLLVAAHRV